MLFPTVEYAAFFILSLILAWSSIGRHALHKLTLLALSYVFYACWDWRFVPLLFGISFWAWLATRGIQSGRGRRWWLLAGVVGSLGLLAWYKYAAFLLQNLLELAQIGGLNLDIDIQTPFLPLGISFMCFHAISLMMDAWRGKLHKRVALADALLYVAFFPQLVAGPILRASKFLPQLDRAPDPKRIETSRALLLIACGLIKKVLIANTLATLQVDDVFANPLSASASQALAAVYGYAVQIYCDFSGYTDIAIGCALLLGYRFPNNFDSPYKAATPQDFWRRWHISLSTWLRDYLYIPLGGGRSGRVRVHLNLMITMLLGGLWHGAAWNFVLWGGLHGLLLIVHREWDHFCNRFSIGWRRSVWWLWVSRLLLFHAVCLGWVFFRAGSLPVGLDVLGRLVHGEWLKDVSAVTLLCIMVGLGMQYVPSLWIKRVHLFGTWLQPALRGCVFAGILLLIEVLGPSAPAPFIYFQF